MTNMTFLWKYLTLLLSVQLTNMSPSFQVMTFCQISGKPLTESMVTAWCMMPYSVTRPQWVNIFTCWFPTFDLILNLLNNNIKIKHQNDPYLFKLLFSKCCLNIPFKVIKVWHTCILCLNNLASSCLKSKSLADAHIWKQKGGPSSI